MQLRENARPYLQNYPHNSPFPFSLPRIPGVAAAADARPRRPAPPRTKRRTRRRAPSHPIPSHREARAGTTGIATAVFFFLASERRLPPSIPTSPATIWLQIRHHPPQRATVRQMRANVLPRSLSFNRCVVHMAAAAVAIDDVIP